MRSVATSCNGDCINHLKGSAIRQQPSNERIDGHDQIPEVLRLAGLLQPIDRLQSLAAGMLNKVIRVSFAGSHPDVVVRIRQFHDAEYGQEFAAERFAYPLILSKPVRVPRLLFACADTSGCPTLFAVFEYVEGVLIDRRFQDGSYNRLRTQELLAKIAVSLCGIHEVKGEGYGTHTLITHARGGRRQFFEGLFQKEAIKLRQLQIDFACVYDKAVSKWLDLLDLLPESFGGPTLVHGDVHGRNLIIRDEDVFFIDWEASRFRIAPYDLAQFRYLNLRHDPQASAFLIRSYLECSPSYVDTELFVEIVDACQYFWLCRMGLFFLQFPQFETPYFGTAREHLESVKAGIESRYL